MGTETCNYSGFRIYPGHGKKFVRVDQKMFNFITGKTMACQQMKRRNLTTKWTVQSREIVGISDEMLAKKRTARPTTKRSDAQTAAVLSHLKSRKGAKK